MARNYAISKAEEPPKEPLTLNENGEAVVEAVSSAAETVAHVADGVVNGFETETATQNFVVCPYCGSRDVHIQIVETGQQTTRKGVGLGGRVNNTARFATAVLTLGMSNNVWKKSEGTMKTKAVMSKVAICNTCGHDWVMNQQRFGSAPKSIFR